MSSASAGRLFSGYRLPFAVRVPKRSGFLSNSRGAILMTLNHVNKQAERRLRRAVDVFVNVAATGALAGADIPPARSGISLAASATDLPTFKFDIDRAALDDSSVVVLAHLLYTQNKWLDMRTLQVLIEGASEYVSVAYHPDQLSSYPRRVSVPPFEIVDEEPETDGVTFSIEFGTKPSAATIVALDRSFSTWSDAVLRGAYALALVAPEDSHVESYDDELTVIDKSAERSYHKLTADDAALDAVVNMLAAAHERFQAIERVTIG